MRTASGGPWVEVPFAVQGPQEGLRVDAYLAARLHRYSRAEVQRLVEAGRVFLSRRGAAALRGVKASVRLSKGDTVIVRYPRREEPPARHEALAVLYEDSDLLAVNKPGDVLSHPTDRVTLNSVTSILRRQFPGLSLHLAHRLDRETSGVLLLAKSAAAARELTRQFTVRSVRKEYLALVAGRVPFGRRTVELPLGREGGGIKVRQAVVEGTREGARQAAATGFVRVAAGKDRSLLRAVPSTGRLHQIRVHLAWLGHPVLGDKLYTGSGEMYLKAVRRELTPGDLRALGAPRQMLHAWRLSLRHPSTGAPLTLTAPPPTDFIESAAGLWKPSGPAAS